MTTLAYGPAIETEAIISLDLDADGNLLVTIELEVGEETHTLPASHVAPEVRALALSPSAEQAA